MGPAEQDDGGSRPKSVSSLLIRLSAMSVDYGVERWVVEEMYVGCQRWKGGKERLL